MNVLSRHKRPRLFVEMAALPRNPQGKVSRKKLRETVLAQHTLIDGPYPALEAIPDSSANPVKRQETLPPGG